jgi:dipeptidase E
MRLFLASEIKHPTSMQQLEKFIDGFKGKNIAYIPTASNGEDGYGYWKGSSSYNTIKSTNATVTPVVLEEYRSSKVVEVLRQSDIIWFAGGFWGYLMYWINVCQIDLHIRELLNSGKVYVGSSAGSNITGKSLDIAEWFRYDLQEWGIERGGSRLEGLGLVDFDIYPHYTEELYDYIKEHYKGNKMYLLKNGEAITVEDGVVTVLGEERVIGK